ncbi:MAG: carbohydrate porin [Pseudomonadota bacterium]
MTPHFSMKQLTLGMAMLCAAGSVPAATKAEAKLLQLVQQLNERLERLEQRNTSLEQQVKAPNLSLPTELDQRVRSLENANAQLEKSLASERISENEPELTTRLKAIEQNALDMKKSVRKIDALEGLKISTSLTTVMQKPVGLAQGTSDANSQLNYRADVTVELPLESIGDIDHKLFAHFRLGQGSGINTPFSNLGAFANAPNALAFRASGSPPDDSVAILGEAYYQASIPLPSGGFKPDSKETLELTFGKMDLFGFFDQNAVAGDESRQFLNSVFVHNPLLDAGGEVGVDANGFQPGFVTAYVNHEDKANVWRLSLGVFGTGEGANYQHFSSSPLVMAQAETKLKFSGLTGNYRAYLWRTGQGQQLDGSIDQHMGWGISVDQSIDEGITLFSRYGKLNQGQLRFDQALIAGAEINGSRWSRGGDSLGVALGKLRASGDYRAAGGSGDLTGDGNGLFAFAPGGGEKIAELYYRYRVNKQVELSPDFQYIWNTGANPDAQNVSIYGLRAQFSY